MPSPFPTTQVIELTPPGRAAVAVVLVVGPDAVQIVDECLHRAGRRRLAEMPLNHIALGRWNASDGEELIACRRAEDMVEIHCHGGSAAVRAVVAALVDCGGATLCWQDWLQRSVDDPIRAAAQIALAAAPTARTAAILLDQYQGALTNAVRSVLADASANDWQAAMATIEVVLAHRNLGLHLTSPWRVVLAGWPNVGKSSLLNALVGFQRAIVCDMPGTTRDVVTATTAIDGWPIHLADTAGLRETSDAVESAGVARATSAIETADLVLLIDDATDRPETQPLAVSHLRILNKIDLLPRAMHDITDRWDVCTSAVTGEGMGELVAAIGRTLTPAPPAPGAAVPFTMDQIERLDAARIAIERRNADAVTSRLRPLLNSKLSG